MRFYFFEYVFFASALGTLALLPTAFPFMPYLALPAVALILSLAGITTLGTLSLSKKQKAHPARKTALAAGLLAGCAAFFTSIAGQSLPPIFIAWAIAALIATLTFGSILARRFFRRVERDFVRNIGHVFAVSLIGNAVLLALVSFFASFPPPLSAVVTTLITVVALI